MLCSILVALVAGTQKWSPVPVIGYHGIDGPPEFDGGPRYDVHGLNISVATFRDQLALMYKDGFRPISLRDLVLKKLPKEGRPIVLTFDDGRPSQFRYLPDGSIDPNCAVGMLLAFHKAHPDWPLRGTFYIIAGSEQNGVPFDQDGSEVKKLKQLLAWGFEIGNHTLTHPSFQHLKRSQIVHEIEGCYRYLKHVLPAAMVNTLALPYGEQPINQSYWPLLRRAKGARYHNIAVALFDGELCPSPFSRKFNPYAISRIAPEPGNVEKTLAEIARNP
ncbi:MAG TPA: polysaccharide deacetylase family protein [Fimbriimonadaceae bacterium]|jgi:peptidoglycan/xylan/chitin deacetylase (PgdA/CDA1 family)